MAAERSISPEQQVRRMALQLEAARRRRRAQSKALTGRLLRS